MSGAQGDAPDEGRGKGEAHGSSGSGSGSPGAMQKECSFSWSQGHDGDGDSSSSSDYASTTLPSLGLWHEPDSSSAPCIVLEANREAALHPDLDDQGGYTILSDEVSKLALLHHRSSAPALEHASLQVTPAPAPAPAPAAAAAAAAPSHSRALRRSSALACTEGSTELFSFKMRDKVAEAERRSPSPTLFLSRPSKSYSEMKAGDVERLSAMSRPSHSFSDMGPSYPWGSSSEDRPSLSMSEFDADPDAAWPSPELMAMLRQGSGSSSIPEDSELQPQHLHHHSSAGNPISITRICSDSYSRRSAPAAAAAPPAWSRSSSCGGPSTSTSAFPPRLQQQQREPRLEDDQLRAHAIVYARAKSISIEEACTQLELKCLRARRKNSLPLDSDRPSTSGGVLDKAERKST